MWAFIYSHHLKLWQNKIPKNVDLKNFKVFHLQEFLQNFANNCTEMYKNKF